MMSEMRDPAGIALAGAAGLVAGVDDRDRMSGVENRVRARRADDAGADDEDVHAREVPS